MPDSTTDRVSQLFEYGALHIDTYRPDGFQLALRTTVSLNGDVITKFDPTALEPSLVSYHRERVDATVKPLTCALDVARRILWVVEQGRPIVAAGSLVGTSVATAKGAILHTLTWQQVLSWLAGSGLLVWMVVPLVRTLLYAVLRRKLAQVLGPTGHSANE